MTLLASFAIAAQNRAVGQARVLEKVRAAEEERLVLQSVRAVALPLVGEVMLDRTESAEISVTADTQSYVIALSSAERRDWYGITVKP